MGVDRPSPPRPPRAASPSTDLRAGCAWRNLPRDFQPESTVWRYFDEGRRDGTLELVHDLCRAKARAAEKPYSPRTNATVDSQSVDTSMNSRSN